MFWSLRRGVAVDTADAELTHTKWTIKRSMTFPCHRNINPMRGQPNMFHRNLWREHWIEARCLNDHLIWSIDGRHSMILTMFFLNLQKRLEEIIALVVFCAWFFVTAHQLTKPFIHCRRYEAIEKFGRNLTFFEHSDQGDFHFSIFFYSRHW